MFSGADGFNRRGVEEEVMVAHKENNAVWSLRLLVGGVLLLSMVLVGVGTYFYTNNTEVSAFEENFHEHAVKVLSALSESLHKTLGGVDTYVVSMMSYAKDTNSTWPFVTIPDFEARSEKVLAFTKAVVFMQFLLITPETRPEWEKYSAQHGRTWADESLAYLKENDLFQDVFEKRNITEPPYIDVIHDYSAWGVEDPKGLPDDCECSILVPCDCSASVLLHLVTYF